MLLWCMCLLKLGSAISCAPSTVTVPYEHSWLSEQRPEQRNELFSFISDDNVERQLLRINRNIISANWSEHWLILSYCANNDAFIANVTKGLILTVEIVRGKRKCHSEKSYNTGYPRKLGAFIAFRRKRGRRWQSPKWCPRLIRIQQRSSVILQVLR